MEKIKQFLEKENIEYFENFDISTLSSIRLGGKIKIAIFPKTVKELKLLVMFFFKNKIYIKIIGGASNVLFVENISYPVIITSKMIDEILVNGNMVEVSAGVPIIRFCEYLKKNRLSGFEGLVGIPATVGGAIFNNAGAFGYSISDKLVKIKVFFEGKIFEINRNEIHFGYHYSSLFGFIILSATFLFDKTNEYDIIKLSNEFTYKRNLHQPNGLSLGSVFKQVNGKSAGFYIERAGLKDTRLGGIVISNKHSNFFINDKNGSVIDFLRLLAFTQNAVEKQFGISLVTEIEKVGDKNETFGRFTHTFEI